MARRVVVTGAAGFLGGHLVRHFAARGLDVVPVVRAIDDRVRGLAGARAIDALLEEPSRLDGTDVLVHAAAVRHRHGVDEGAYRASNVDLVERLLAASAERVRRFVYVSSVGVYGWPPPSRLPVTEEHPYAPATLYAETKVEAERLVRARSKELGFEHVIVRPTIVYGRGDDNGMLDKMARMIRAGTYRVVGSGRNVLHHTHVDDMAAGIFAAATHPAAANEHFIVCGPETITLARLSELVARALGKRVPRVKVPLPFARAVASAVDFAASRRLAFTKKEPPINHEKLDVMTRSIAFDGDKARRLLGFAPRVGYEEGIRLTLGGAA